MSLCLHVFVCLSVLIELCLYVVADTLTLYGIEPDSSRKLVTNGETIDTTSSFECLRYINPTRTDLETIPATLLWRLNLLESKAEIEFSSDVSGEEFIVTTLPNSSITLNILGGFSGSVSCIHGDEVIKINVATQGECVFTIAEIVCFNNNSKTSSFLSLFKYMDI